MNMMKNESWLIHWIVIMYYQIKFSVHSVQLKQEQIGPFHFFIRLLNIFRLIAGLISSSNWFHIWTASYLNECLPYCKTIYLGIVTLNEPLILWMSTFRANRSDFINNFKYFNHNKLDSMYIQKRFASHIS